MQNQDPGPLQPVHNQKPYKRAEGITQIEHFFRAAAGLEIDKSDIKRYYNFIDQKVADLLLMAQHTAKANKRVRVELRDLPITKRLQESIQAFEALDLDIGLERILDRAVPEPMMDLPYSEGTEVRLPAIAGGLSLAVARTFKIIDPQIKHPATEEWERAFQIFDLLLLCFRALGQADRARLWTEVLNACHPCLQPLQTEEPHSRQVSGQHWPLRSL